MKKYTGLWLLLMGVCCLLVSKVQAGGWAVLTVESWPEGVTAGQPFTVRYVLRQHGNHLMSDVPGQVTAVHMESGESIVFAATDTGEPGRYRVEMQLPTAGDWRWHIDTFGRFEMPLLSVQSDTAVAASAAATSSITPVAIADVSWLLSVGGAVLAGIAVVMWLRRRTRFAPAAALLGLMLCLVGFAIPSSAKTAELLAPPTSKVSMEQGQVLFVAKGCATCHHHEAVDIESNYMGPDLTYRPLDQDYLRKWLSNPPEVRPGTLMPNLELTEAEIEALIAFLQTEVVDNTP